MPCLHFEGVGNARAKEHVLSRLLTSIATKVETLEFGKTESMAISDDFPIPPPPCRNPNEGRNRLREASSDSLTDSYPRFRPAPPENSPTPRVSEISRVAPRPKGPSHPIFHPTLARISSAPKEGLLSRRV